MRLSSPAVVLASLALSTAATVNEPDAFYSALRPCPAECQGTPESWTVYTSLDRLQVCKQPMLLDFAINNALDSPQTTVKLRTCTSGNANDLKNGLLNNTTAHPKRLDGSSSPKCIDAKESKLSFDLFVSGDAGSATPDDLHTAIDQLQHHLEHQTHCDTTFLVGYSDGAVVGVYSGAAIDNAKTISSVLPQLQEHIGSEKTPKSMTLQLCDKDRNADYIFGVVVDTTGNLAAVQKAVMAWSQGTCVDSTGQAAQQLSNVSVFEAPLIPKIANTTVSKNSTRLHARGDCTTVTVVSGDSCGALATKCGISPQDFQKYNPASDLCSALTPGERVCCSSGSLPDITPKPYSNGTCATYTVKSGDNCVLIAASNGLTKAQLESFNDKTTWGWNGCNNLLTGINICLSTGNPPMPAPMANALCGPTAPGTSVSGGQNLSMANPCPLNSCCNIWGQCGITPDFCTIATGPTGNPGTSPPGVNGCISNCGTDIVKGKSAPSQFIKVAYYESWNWDRPCLNYRAQDMGATDYTHAHWAFADVGSDFSVSINDSFTQLPGFLGLPQKKILSFGGWGYSTDPGTYNLLREAMYPQNVDRFVNNIINYMNSNGWDGVDIDWEYPGAPDIPGIPAGLKSDGPNYLTFLQHLRSRLPSGKSLSISAPASFWYLKAFPIADMAKQVDYIVYMTYDLHGQWDYNNQFAQPGCPAGNCLRSHVNITETNYALSMLTKAGVDSSKIVVGVSSYGRSFGLTSLAACQGNIHSPGCTYQGPDSTATPGECTQTAGYISNAEIKEMLDLNGTDLVSFYDADSDSNMAFYGNNWVAYMDDGVKDERTLYYQRMNFCGTVDWAVDLQEYTDDDGHPLDDDDDLPNTTPLGPCNANYKTIEELDAAASSIPDHCVTIYTLTALNNVLKDSMNNYTKLMSGGYDSKFNTYSKAVASSAGSQLHDYIYSNGNKYFSCNVAEISVCCSYCNANKQSSSYCDYCFNGNCNSKRESGPGIIGGNDNMVVKVVNVSEPCPPDYSKRGYGPNNPYIQSVYWSFTNSAGFYSDLQAQTGIPQSKTKIGNYDRGNDCPPSAKSGDQCWASGMDFNIPVINGFSQSDVLNPKSTVQKALSNIQGLASQIDNIITQLHLDGYAGDGVEVIDSVSLVVLMVASATENMEQVVDIANQITKSKEEAIIMFFLSAIFLVIPIAGEVVGAAADLADLGTILNLVGAAGNSALDIYDIVKDPKNSPLAIFDLILEPLALTDLAKISQASDIRRGMEAEDLAKLGKQVDSRMEIIEKVKGVCAPDTIEG